MRVKLLPLLVLMCGTLSSLARDFDYTFEGKTVTYTVLDEDAKTVTTKSRNSVSGDLILPAYPRDGNDRYTLTQIGGTSFDDCRNLTSVSIPNTVTYIGGYAFRRTALTSLVLPNSVTTIDSYAFEQCSSLKSVKLPDNITTIGYGNFSACSSLTEIDIPESVTKIDYGAFSGCTSLKSIVIPNSVTSIEGSIFNNCSSLTSVKLPESLTTITYQMFAQCTSLTSIDIPSQVTFIDSYAFRNCTSLTSIDIPESVTSMNHDAFQGCTNLKSVHLPDLLTRIESYLFGNCTSLSEITLPLNLTTIGMRAFENCNIKSLVIPEQVTTIDSEAFLNCQKLAEVKCLATTPPTLRSGAFKNISDAATLRVPNESLTAYQNSAWAQYFSAIVGFSSSITVNITGDGSVYNNAFDSADSGSEYTGTDFIFFILPDDGNHIASITLDGENMIPDLINHRLVISDYHNAGELDVVFASDGEAKLTVRGADNHSFTHTYKAGTSAVVELLPESGWRLHSLTYNDEDMTHKLNGNVFVTEPLHGENNLNIVLKQDETTDVEEVDSPYSTVKVTTRGDTVIITGLNDGDTVMIHDLSGINVYTGLDREISLNPGNVYIVSTPTKAFKVTL